MVRFGYCGKWRPPQAGRYIGTGVRVCVPAEIARREQVAWDCSLGWRRFGRVGAGLGEVAAAGADLVAIVVGNFDFDAVIFAVGHEIGRAVGDGVLIAKFVADVLERLIEIVHVVGKKSAAAGFFREILQNFVAFGEMHFAIGQLVGIGLGKLDPLGAGADGIDDDVGALGHFDGFGAGVIGEIVVAIADENHDAANDVGLIAGRPRRIA